MKILPMLSARPIRPKTSISAAHSDTNWDIALSSYAAAPLRRYLRGNLCVEHQAPCWSRLMKNLIHKEA